MTEGRCPTCLTLQMWNPGISGPCGRCGHPRRANLDLDLPEALEEKRQFWAEFSEEQWEAASEAEDADEWAFYDERRQLAEAFLRDLWDLAKDHLD